MDQIVAGLAGFRDTMCACTDKACADVITKQMVAWGKKLEAQPELRSTYPSAEQTRQMSELTKAMTRCMTAAMAASAQVASTGADSASGDAGPRNVDGVAMEAHRISGNNQIVPDDETRAAFDASGKARMVGSFKLCITEAGTIRSVQKLKTTGSDRYDQTIMREIRTWRYSPFTVDGTPHPVCTAVTFIYGPTKAPNSVRSRDP